ncbi:MAG: aminotransferase class V-fold PLP-dependent enzyme [Clostridiales bacterium]|nr:aminotransferase class V-fold PLP-dependent enzyme [Clostridiales bacterium]
MNTPIVAFISSYIEKDFVRLHMPGHKGALNGRDITEVKGTDDLIEASERNASAIFGCPTFYSSEGSSLAIRAMLSILLRHTGKKTVVASRNCHQTFISACALLDLDVVWLPCSDLISSSISLETLENILKDTDPCCVYITSPDYLGTISDITSIASLCHENGTYLAVDNAHGAYLKFFNMHPMDLGADICCDSAHKTLPVLTGGAYLHVSNDLNLDVRRELSLFSSTSPSWLILESLDRANATMADQDFMDKLQETASLVKSLRTTMDTCGSEPLKVTLAPNSYGYTGDEVADILRTNGIEPEFSDMNYLTLMFSPYNTDKDYEKLQKALDSIVRKPALNLPHYIVPEPSKVLGIRQAVFSKTTTISVEDAEGKVAGFVKTSCPPAIPIVTAGERITAEHIKVLKAYGFETIEVCCDFE